MRNHFINFTKKKLAGRVVVLHSVCWLAYVGYELLYLRALQGHLEAWRIYAVHYTLNILLFYGQLAVMSATFPTKARSLLLRAGCIIALVTIYLLFKLLALYLLTLPRQLSLAELAGSRVTLVSAFYRGGYFMLLATFYWAAGHLADYKRRLAEARSAYLQQQINPHLLFNTLNLIYSKVYRQSPEAARPVQLLAELMRFSLAETGADGRVPLAAELEQLEYLFEINRSRFNEPLYLETELPEALPDQRILPLILLTLTENIFKHGNLLDPQHPARLRLCVDSSRRLTYYCRNLKKAKPPERPLQSLGLQNAKVRLDLAYADRYKLAVRDEGNFFELTLTLPV